MAASPTTIATTVPYRAVPGGTLSSPWSIPGTLNSVGRTSPPNARWTKSRFACRPAKTTPATPRATAATTKARALRHDRCVTNHQRSTTGLSLSAAASAAADPASHERSRLEAHHVSANRATRYAFTLPDSAASETGELNPGYGYRAAAASVSGRPRTSTVTRTMRFLGFATTANATVSAVSR